MKKLIGMAFAMSAGLALLGLGWSSASAMTTSNGAAPQSEVATTGISRVYYYGYRRRYCGGYFYLRGWGVCVRCCNYNGCWRVCDGNYGAQ